MNDIVERLRDSAIHVAPLGSASGIGRWTGAQTMREAANEIIRLRAQAGKLAGFLGIFLGEDDRFMPMIGGNPNAVDAIIADARTVLHEFRTSHIPGEDTPAASGDKTPAPSGEIVDAGLSDGGKS